MELEPMNDEAMHTPPPVPESAPPKTFRQDSDEEYQMPPVGRLRFASTINEYAAAGIPMIDETDRNGNGENGCGVVGAGRPALKRFTSRTSQTSILHRGSIRAMRTLGEGILTDRQHEEHLSYLDQFDCLPPPLFILAISLAELAVFIYYYADNPRPEARSCPGCFIFDSRGKRIAIGPFLFSPDRRSEVWRFLTYAFLHGGWSHLIGNLVVQLVVGLPLEIVHKPWRIAPFYLFAVAFGALLQYLFNPSISLVGASAGVYALIGAHVSNVVLNWNEMPFRWVRVVILGAFIGWDLGSVVYSQFVLHECMHTSYIAHVGGLLTGLFVGYFMLYNIFVEPLEKIFRWVALAVYIILFLAAVVTTIFRQPYSSALLDSNC